MCWAPFSAARFSGVDIVIFDVVAMVAQGTIAEVDSGACGFAGVGRWFVSHGDS